MATINGIPSTTVFQNIGGQIMVQTSPGVSRNATSQELAAYNANPKAFTVYGPGRTLLQTGTGVPATSATTAPQPAPAPVAAPVVTAAPIAPTPVTTTAQQLDALRNRLGQGTPEQQMATLQSYQRLQSEAAQAARNASTAPAPVVQPVAAPAPAPVVRSTPAPVATPTPVATPAPAAAPVASTPTTPVNPFSTTPPTNWKTPASYATPVTVDIPRLNLNYWFQNQPTPFSFPTPVNTASTGMGAFAPPVMPSFNWAPPRI